MAITLGQASTNSGEATTSVDLTHTNETGTGRVLVVSVHMEDNAPGGTISSVVFDPGGGDETSLTADVTESASNGNKNTVAIYSVAADGLPTTGTDTITITASESVVSLVGYARMLLGAAQDNAEATASDTEASSSTLSSAITTLTDGAFIWEAITAGDPATAVQITPQSGQTELVDAAAGTKQQYGILYEEAATAGAYTQQSDLDNADRCAQVLAAFAPVADPDPVEDPHSLTGGAESGGGPPGLKGQPLRPQQRRPNPFPRQVRIGDMIVTVQSQAELNRMLQEYDMRKNTTDPEQMLYTTRYRPEPRERKPERKKYRRTLRLGERLIKRT